MKFRIVSPTVGEYRKANHDHSYPPLDFKVGEVEARCKQDADRLLTELIVQGKYPKGSAVIGEELLSFPKPEYIILRGIEMGNKFFSKFIPGEDPTTLVDGTKAYIVLGYANTVQEALIGLHGKRACIRMGLIMTENL